MKRFIISILAIAALTASKAQTTFNYLVVTSTDGTQTALPISGLTIKFADGNLVATTADGTRQIAIASLDFMTFSEQGQTTAIDPSTATDTDAEVQVFTVGGILKGSFDSVAAARKELPKGIYIVRQQKRAFKITIE